MITSILLIISVLSCLLPLIDFLLRPHQRKEIQTFLEDYTLRIDDIRPGDLALSINEPSIQALIIMLTYMEFALLCVLVLPFMWLITRLPDLRAVYDAEIVNVQIVGILLSIITLSFAWRWPLPRLMCWMLAGGERRKMWFRLFKSVFVGVILLLVYQLILGWALTGKPLVVVKLGGKSFTRSAYMWGLLPVWPAITIFSVVTQGVSLTFNSNRWQRSSLLALFKATLWRIIEYNRGAALAFTSVLTAFIAIIKLLGS